MSDSLNFKEYLCSSDSSLASKSPAKELTEEERLDEDRSQRIDDLFKQYETQAKKSEELLKNNAKKEKCLEERLKENEMFNLGDVGQFVHELNADMPTAKDISWNKESTLEKTPEINQELVSFRSEKNNKITIDLFKVQKAELNKKAAIYKKRQMSPAVPTHERLFAKAMEKDAKSKLRQVSANRKRSCKPLTNKISNEMMKDRNPEATADVIYSHTNSCFTKTSSSGRRRLSKSYFK